MQRNKKTIKTSITEVDFNQVDTLLLIMSHCSEMMLLIANQIMCQNANELAGKKHVRDTDLEYYRHGYNPTHIKIGREKLRALVPRLRHRKTGETINVPILEKLQNIPSNSDDLIKQMISGISMRDFEKVATQFAESFGISKSTLSREFIEESKEALVNFEKRILDDTYVAIFVDDKYLADSQILIVVGVTTDGKKKILTFKEIKSEHSESIAEIFRDILNRGFKHDNGILVIADGAKGWHKVARDVFGASMILQRCQIHTIRNVLSYLSKADQEYYEVLLKEAFQIEDYHEAKSTLEKLATKIDIINRSSAQSLREGLEETLTYST